MRDLAQGWFAALAALVRHVEQPGAGGRSPCDLPLCVLSQGEIEGLERRYPQIEEVLPLSPLQEGLLFHALYDGRGADVYTVQLVLGLGGPAGRGGVAGGRGAAGNAMPACGPASGIEQPEPSGAGDRAAGAVPWRSLDLSQLDEAERERRLARFLAEDRADRFDLAAAPLIRFALIRLSARAAPAGDHQPSHSDGWLVDAGAG